ncbi:MAG: hypothetical protein JSS81_05385 [Acidobacteria bacterium]|nr:hypothetical protein [Acidobacteriota bacterium]
MRVPPPRKPDETPGEYYRRSSRTLFPGEDFPAEAPSSDDTFLVVKLDENGKVRLNGEPVAGIADLRPLSRKLRRIFDERERNGVRWENSRETVRAVMIEAPRSAKYGEIIKIIDAAKTSGADPIVLRIDYR